MYSVKTLEDMNGEESRLERLNKEDQAIVEDEDAALFDKEAAQERIEARNEELARLQARIEEGEVALPFRERIKEIFKKKWCHSDRYSSCHRCHYRGCRWSHH